MNNRVIISAALVLLLALATAGCARLKTDVDSDTITDVESLVEYLQENNISLLDHGPFISQQMSVTGYEYTPLSGGILRVFKYPTDADALADVSQVERRRDVRQPSHLYRKKDLVVIYEGDDPRIDRVLLRIFGSRLA